MFITFEGIEGSGKTTQIQNIVKYLESSGNECIATREPGNTKIGRKIRSILLDPENTDLVPLAELFLYAADRAQHIEERVIPALDAGKTVVCDRFFDATLAYQGFARGLDLELIKEINGLVLGGLKPDITFLFDLAPEQGLERAWKQLDDGSREGKESRFENEAVSFHRRVREGYLEIASKDPERFRIIDASKSPGEVFNEIIKFL